MMATAATIRETVSELPPPDPKVTVVLPLLSVAVVAEKALFSEFAHDCVTVVCVWSLELKTSKAIGQTWVDLHPKKTSIVGVVSTVVGVYALNSKRISSSGPMNSKGNIVSRYPTLGMAPVGRWMDDTVIASPDAVFAPQLGFSAGSNDSTEYDGKPEVTVRQLWELPPQPVELAPDE